MTENTDLISLRGLTSLSGLKDIKFEVHIDVPLISNDVVLQVVTPLRDRMRADLSSSGLNVLSDIDEAPSLKLFVNLNQGRDCVTGMEFYLYRVEMVLREFVTTERDLTSSFLADTWRTKANIGYVAVSKGIRSLEAAVLSEVDRQRKAFLASLTRSRALSLIPVRTPTETQLENTIGKHISTFCGNNYTTDAANHCAHFVSHLLDLQFGATCQDIVGGTATPGSLRVHEIFARCDRVGRWTDLPATTAWGLVFLTNPANVDLAKKQMRNVPNKHVGIFFGPARNVYQYKNATRQVVKQAPVEFAAHYAAPDNGMFWGVL